MGEVQVFPESLKTPLDATIEIGRRRYLVGVRSDPCSLQDSGHLRIVPGAG